MRRNSRNVLWIASLVAIGAATTISRGARADGNEGGVRPAGIVVVPLDVTERILRDTPALSLNGDEVSRRYVGAPVPSAAHFTTIGAGLALSGGTNESSIYVSIFHARFAFAPSAAPATVLANGASYVLNRGSEQYLELSFPGVGFNAPMNNRVFFRGEIDTGFAVLWSHASLASTAGDTLTSGSVNLNLEVYVHTPLSVCYRLRASNDDVVPDACLTVIPTITEWAGMNGVAAGLRVDL